MGNFGSEAGSIASVFAETAQNITLDGSWFTPAVVVAALAILWWRMGQSEKKIEGVDKTVRGHDATDQILTGKVEGLGDRMDALDKRQDRFESYVMGEFVDIKADLNELLRRSPERAT